MNPTSTPRLRSITAALAVGWALLALALSLTTVRAPEDRFYHPFGLSIMGGSAIIQALGPGAAEAGADAEPGDRILEVNGESFRLVLRRGCGWLRAGVSNTYLLEKRDGRLVSVDLPPESLVTSRRRRRFSSGL